MTLLCFALLAPRDANARHSGLHVSIPSALMGVISGWIRDDTQALFGFGDGGVTNTVAFGYKRKEMTVIPRTASGTFPSVLAKLDNATNSKTLNETSFTAKQFFATGIAANNLAPAQAALFQKVASDALGAYRNAELVQTQSIGNTLKCLAELRDDQLAAVWNHAEALNLFAPDTALYPEIKSEPNDSARTMYSSEIAIVNADSVEYGSLLALHEAFVCRLVGVTP